MSDRHHHDIGGEDCGPVVRDETPLTHWQWESEAVCALMGEGRHGSLTLDRLRRASEKLGVELYDRGVHERRTDGAIAQVRARREAEA